MAAGLVIGTVLGVVTIVVGTGNVASWAFRPDFYGRGRRARRWMGVCTAAWVILLPVGGAYALAFGGGWQGVVAGAFALACDHPGYEKAPGVASGPAGSRPPGC